MKPKQSENRTFIKWVSVLDELPKEIKTVLILMEGETEPSIGRFDPHFGWTVAKNDYTWYDTSKRQSASSWKVNFWSEYNLPK